MKGGEIVKATFFSILILMGLVTYGLIAPLDLENSTTNKSKDYQAYNSKKESKEIKTEEKDEMNFKKLDLLQSTDEAVEEELPVENIPIEQEEIINDEEDNEPIAESLPAEEETQEIPETKEENNNLDNIKETVSVISNSLNQANSIDEVKTEGIKLFDLDTSYIMEVAQIKQDIDAATEEYNNVLAVDNFLNTSNELIANKTIDNINKLREDAKNTNIEEMIYMINNEKIKEEYSNKFNKIKDILDDEAAPVLNVNDTTYTSNVDLIISDDTNCHVYLNGEEFDPQESITDNGIYELVVVDEALNETKVNFNISKPEEIKEEVVTSPVIEVTSEPVSVDETPVATINYPMHNYYITQDYSGKDGHMGIDFGSSNKSEEIYPITDGTVIYVGQDNYGANVVKIKHDIDGQEVYSTYAHMQEVYLTPGQTVSSNDLLGLMGSTGNSTGPHLHLEMTTCDWTNGCSYSTYKDSLVNPLDYLNPSM